MKKWFQKPGPENDAVFFSSVSLARNFKDLPFPGRMDDGARREVIRRVRGAAEGKNSALSGTLRYIPLRDLTEEEAVSLAERDLADADFIAEKEGRGLLISEDESLCILLNGKDHLLIRAFAPGFALKRAYAAADSVDSVLDRRLSFAFDSRLGYLTRNISSLGTGMRASLVLHLPALEDSGSMPRLSSSLSRLGMSLHGFDLSREETRGAIYRLSNRMTLGLSEREAIANLTGIAEQILAQEREGRKELAGSLGVQDTVSRSLGLLESARLLKNSEFLELISLVRFGISAGFFPRLRYETIDELIARVQPATLSAASGEDLSLEKLRALRARIVRETLGEKREGA